MIVTLVPHVGTGFCADTDTAIARNSAMLLSEGLIALVLASELRQGQFAHGVGVADLSVERTLYVWLERAKDWA